VPKAVYERCRAAVRAAPLVSAKGRLERHEGTTNVVVTEVVELDRPTSRKASTGPRSAPGRTRQRPPRRRIRERAVAELRAVAPAGHSFGRRRG
jgi:hypothetical protein